MNGTGLAILLILGIILLVILYKLFKPYFIKHDTTITVCGGVGSGKTLTTLPKLGVVLIRKQRIKYYYIGNLIIRIKNRFRKIINYFHLKWNTKHAKKKRKNKKIYELQKLRKKPMLYCNIPCHFKSHMFSRKREWAVKLKASHLLCLEEVIEYSVIVVDEFPQFINQFNWNDEMVQKNVNEFITFIRHYIGGYFIINCQAIDDVVCQVRRKLNQATWCFDFHKWGWPIPLFYTIRMCDIQLSEQMTTITTSYIEENTRLHFGLFPPRKTYDTRCYSVRYKNIYKKAEKYTKEDFFNDLKTSKVLRLVEYKSALDDITTNEEKAQQWERGEKRWKN